MEKESIEIEIYRERVAEYFAWSVTLFLFVTLVWFFGLGIIVAIVYRLCIAPWLCPQQAQALKYRLETETLRIDYGVYFLKRKAIPLDRITDVALVQGPLMRFTGGDFWCLQIQTSGTGTPTPEATLCGIHDPERVREAILAKRDAYIVAKKHS